MPGIIPSKKLPLTITDVYKPHTAPRKNEKAQSFDWAFENGSPARIPFGFAKGKLTREPEYLS
jgi:hypothetical protein